MSAPGIFFTVLLGSIFVFALWLLHLELKDESQRERVKRMFSEFRGKE